MFFFFMCTYPTFTSFCIIRHENQQRRKRGKEQGKKKGRRVEVREKGKNKAYIRRHVFVERRVFETKLWQPIVFLYLWACGEVGVKITS